MEEQMRFCAKNISFEYILQVKKQNKSQMVTDHSTDMVLEDVENQKIHI